MICLDRVLNRRQLGIGMPKKYELQMPNIKFRLPLITVPCKLFLSTYNEQSFPWLLVDDVNVM